MGFSSQYDGPGRVASLAQAPRPAEFAEPRVNAERTGSERIHALRSSLERRMSHGQSCIQMRRIAASCPPKEIVMLHYAIVFLVIALIAAVLGFGGIAGASAGIAKILFVVFLILFIASLVMGRRGRPPV
jgi:uncharacterized membrane protein YtjA (UPF0391 family)